MPLTPNIALFGNNCGITGYREIDHNFVREINNRVLRRASNMLISSGAIDERSANAFTRRMPQSLLLKFIDLPDGRADEIIRKQKEAESEAQSSNGPTKKTTEQPKKKK